MLSIFLGSYQTIRNDATSNRQKMLSGTSCNVYVARVWILRVSIIYCAIKFFLKKMFKYRTNNPLRLSLSLNEQIKHNAVRRNEWMIRKQGVWVHTCITHDDDDGKCKIDNYIASYSKFPCVVGRRYWSETAGVMDRRDGADGRHGFDAYTVPRRRYITSVAMRYDAAGVLKYRETIAGQLTNQIETHAYRIGSKKPLESFCGNRTAPCTYVVWRVCDDMTPTERCRGTGGTSKNGTRPVKKKC